MIFAGFLALFNWYVAMHIATRWDAAQQHPVIFWLAAILFFVSEMFWLAAALWIPPGQRRAMGAAGRKGFEAANFVSFLALGIFSCQFMFTFAGDVIGAVLTFAAPRVMPVVDQYNLPVICTLTLVTVVVGMIQARVEPVVRNVDVPLKNLPPAFEGFTIAQISDLHVSPTLHGDYVEKVVRITNAFKPDLVALTGDFIDGLVEELRPDVAPLSRLSAPFGVYFIMGNHEYYWNPDAWIAEFKKLGARVLVNQHEVIRKDSGAILLAGVSDYSTRHAHRPDAHDPKKALEGAPEGLVKILLAHQPASYKDAHAAGYDLQLSGHTHAGQYFPFNLIIGFFQKYYRGLNNHEGMWVHVNTGTGFWGPPLRTGVPPEITRLRLVKA